MSIRPTTQASRPLEASDATTLAVATPPLTAELLSGWSRGQEVFLSTLESALAADQDPAQGLAEAHRLGLAASGLSTQVYAQVESVVRSFCGVQHTVQVLEEKASLLERQERSDDTISRIRREARTLSALLPLRQRHGDVAVEQLLADAPSLMGLHARHRALLGR